MGRLTSEKRGADKREPRARFDIRGFVVKRIKEAIDQFRGLARHDRSVVRLTVDLSHDDLDGYWVAAIKELPGCMSQGRTPAEALDNVSDAFAEQMAVRMRKAVDESSDNGDTPSSRLLDSDSERAIAICV